MRLFITAAVLLLNVNVFASDSVVAADYTCKDLKSLVKTNKAVVIETKLGAYTVYSNGMPCFEENSSAKFLSVKASDKSCVVGLVCDIYAGN